MPNRRPRTIPSRQPWLSPFRKSGHHDDCRSLYWRSEARLPTGLASRPTCRGTCPPQVLEAQGAKGRSRLAGPCRQVYRIDELTDDMKGTGVVEKDIVEDDRFDPLHHSLWISF